ncbi:MAG: hypothetical protein H7263_14525 [Candidatus Sericytochromatia bacterium]|nr:hypothetical protein [Candidatus Sericytochromatia bacterium]
MAIMTKKVSPDKKGRLTLGKLVEGVDGFNAEKLEDGTIILTPYVELHPREVWLYKNPQALLSLEKGLKQAAEGKTEYLGDFSQYADIEID